MTEAKLPRCIAYLSLAGDLITLELASGPKFTSRDVEAIVQVLRADRAKLQELEASEPERRARMLQAAESSVVFWRERFEASQREIGRMEDAAVAEARKEFYG